MKSENRYHQDEEQISRAVVDETDLTEEFRNHLAGCRVCRDKVEKFRQELGALGEFARQAVPPMEKKIVLPADESTSADHNTGWLPSFGALVMAGLVLFVYFLGIEKTTPPRLTGVVNLEERTTELILEDEDLMDEIFEMVEYPLPDVMYEITGDSGEYLDEFIEFVVPENQEDFQS